MRKNYFAKIVKYIKDVYSIETGIRNLQDKRKNPTSKTDKIVLPVLFGFILRIRSFKELHYMIKNNEFKVFYLKDVSCGNRFNSWCTKGYRY